mmetsp:Transcript_10202/g.19329  ORF Transcript_10202/g.19329 Transcript_10202/m.19329 type:complete len:161 (-) Transcript_10202:240-722(-)
MGQSSSTKVQDAAREAGLEKLSGGVSGAEAERLWTVYDADGNGVLDRNEAKKLVQDMIRISCEGLQQKIDSLRAALNDEATVDELVNSIDLDKDGRITKSEFVAKAMFGVQLSTEQVHRAQSSQPSIAAEASDLPREGTVSSRVQAFEAGNRGTKRKADD